MTSWPDVIKGAIERSLDGLHTSIPAEVVSYTAATQQCTLAPVIDGMPEMQDVPVAWPRGGGYYLHLPMEPGDHVVCVFCEQDFGPWRLAGGALAPALLRRHGLFAYAIPGAATETDILLQPSLSSGVVLGKDGGMQVRVGGATVELGAFPAVQAVALATLVDAAITAITVAYNTHIHSYVPPAAVVTGPPIVPLSPQAPVGSTAVKVSS